MANPITESTVYTILTEESPAYDEIRFILEIILQINNIPDFVIDPSFDDDNKFSGQWIINLHAICVEIIVKLFKGESSCVDYLVYDGVVDNATCPETALCVLESTKTTDKSSRNTSVNQRITKFMVFNRLYPASTAKKIMFYNDEWIGNDLTDTGSFGLRLMKSLQIDAFHVNNCRFENLYTKFNISEFLTIEDMLATKNNILSKKGNVSVKLYHFGNNGYSISCKLDKGIGSSCGKISHDPNVGLLTGLLNFMHAKNKNISVVIQTHGVSQLYFDKCPRSKFWYAINGIQVSFEDRVLGPTPAMPSKYFTLETKNTEKLATILFSQVIKKVMCIFSNHSGCALSNIKTPKSDIVVERTMPRPDILFYNHELNEMFIIEGKIERDIHLGINQLSDDNLGRFIVLIQSAYPDCIIKKGLCITIDSIVHLQKYKSLKYPVMFALDSHGAYYSAL